MKLNWIKKIYNKNLIIQHLNKNFSNLIQNKGKRITDKYLNDIKDFE
jgi:hypothetical protein